MKLYCYPGAASLAVHIALREVEADFYLERVNLHTKQVEPPRVSWRLVGLSQTSSAEV